MKMTLYVVLSLFIVLVTSYYQRVTGPTYEKRVEVSLNNTDYKFHLLRSHEIGTICKLKLTVPDTSIKATLHYRRFPTNESYISREFQREGEVISAELPEQPAAGKLQYYITFSTADKNVDIPENEPVIIRFKGAVPKHILITHIIFIFMGMWFSNLTGVLALVKHEKQKFYAVLTLIFLVIGGLIFGPFVQKFAFNEYWAGIPFGWDLTDNKTLISVTAWLVALLGNLKKERRWLFITAAVVTIAVFIIPHSFMGSEFDYQKGKITTG
jgi:hypothetical protein